MFLEKLKYFFTSITVPYALFAPYIFGIIALSAIYFDKVIKKRAYLIFYFFAYLYVIIFIFTIDGLKWGTIRILVFIGVLIILYKYRFRWFRFDQK